MKTFTKEKETWISFALEYRPGTHFQRNVSSLQKNYFLSFIFKKLGPF